MNLWLDNYLLGETLKIPTKYMKVLFKVMLSFLEISKTEGQKS
jgi:hypothetical protein